MLPTRLPRLPGLALDALLVLMAVQAIVLMAQALKPDDGRAASARTHESVSAHAADAGSRVSSIDASAHSRMLVDPGYVLLDSGISDGYAEGPGNARVPPANCGRESRHACRDPSANEAGEPLWIH